MINQNLLLLYRPGSCREPGRDDCPSEEELVRAASEDLAGPNRGRLGHHLLNCPACGDEYRLIRPLKPWAEKVATILEHPESADAVGGCPSIQSQPEIYHETARKRTGRFGHSDFFLIGGYTLAALLLLLAAGLCFWVLLQSENQRLASSLDNEVAQQKRALASAQQSLEEARRQLDEVARRAGKEKSTRLPRRPASQVAASPRAVQNLPHPQPHSAIFNLEPLGSLSSSPLPGATLLEISSNAKMFTLVLNVTGQRDYSSYAVRISDEAGRVVWQGQGLRKSPNNTLNLGLVPGTMPAGRYQINLLGWNGNQEQLLEPYSIQVRYKR